MLGILKEGQISQILHEAEVGRGTTATTGKDRRLERHLQSYHQDYVGENSSYACF